MRRTICMCCSVAAIIGLLCPAFPVSGATPVSFDLKYGVLAPLTGNSAAAGQAWNEAASVGIKYVTATLKKLDLPDIHVVLADSQDSQGNTQTGVEAAQKLVKIDGVNVVIGDFYSAVTSAVATAVTIPNRVLEFTGGTSPALTKLNTGTPAFLWQPVAADDVQGRVLAKIIAAALGPHARINVAARNDAYGTSLSAVFKEAWTSTGGTIPVDLIYDPTQPTLDAEAQKLVQGNPTGWLFIDFCQTFDKLAFPLARSGKWDPKKSFGSDTLNDCKSNGAQSFPGMRATQAYPAGGASFPAFQALFEQDAGQRTKFQPFTAEAFDSVFVSFLAALEAKSAEPAQIARYVVPLTNPPGTAYTFQQLDAAIKAVMTGQKIRFEGATGPLNFTDSGRVAATTYAIWQVQPDGSSKVIKVVNFTP